MDTQFEPGTRESTTLRLSSLRSAKNTSAPSDANAFATAEPTEPPSPKTTARLPCDNG